MSETPAPWSTTGDKPAGDGRWLTIPGPFIGVLWTDGGAVGLTPAAPTVDGQAEAFATLKAQIEQAGDFDEVVRQLKAASTPERARYLIVKTGDLSTWREKAPSGAG